MATKDTLRKGRDWDYRIGLAIRVFRTWRRMTQRELAAACDISANYVSTIESGTKSCNSLKTLDCIAAALQVKLSSLVKFAEEPESLETALEDLRKALDEEKEPVEAEVTLAAPTAPTVVATCKHGNGCRRNGNGKSKAKVSDGDRTVGQAN